MKDQIFSHVQKLSCWYFTGIATAERDLVHERAREKERRWGTSPVIFRWKDSQDGQNLAAKGLKGPQHPLLLLR